MSVTFMHMGEHLASSRYRAIIPAKELAKLGVHEGKDWIVIGKHNWKWEERTEGFKKKCFDICDDRFESPWAEHYTINALRADLVTCNSEEMKRRIREKTGRDAVVIPDPYEQREHAPEMHDKLLWFGHQSNVVDIAPYVGKLRNLEIITNAPGFRQWSPQAMDEAFHACGLVVIPTGKSMCKSGNRAIESIRRGRFVVAGYLPAYADLGIYIGDIVDGVRWCLEHKSEVLWRTKSAQEYVREEYAPQRIAKLWKQALFG